MFGGPPPPPSPEELAQQQAVARQTVYSGLATCVLLYMSPHAIEYVKRLI